MKSWSVRGADQPSHREATVKEPVASLHLCGAFFVASKMSHTYLEPAGRPMTGPLVQSLGVISEPPPAWQRPAPSRTSYSFLVAG